MDDCSMIIDGPAANRIISLSGGHNFRDIGGYRTIDGRMTAWGLVYRSGTMASLDASDHAVSRSSGCERFAIFAPLRSVPSGRRCSRPMPTSTSGRVTTI